MAEHRARILEQDGYTRRGFFAASGRLLGAAGLGFLVDACAAQLHPRITMNVNPDLLKRTVNIGEYLKKPATEILNRTFPTIARSRGGRRADFDNYLRPNNPLTGAAAVSYAPNPGQKETYATPGAYGVIVGLGNLPISGKRAVVFYGNGYMMFFGHLKEWDGYKGKRVGRFTKIGEMGDTGAGAREPSTGQPITHLNTVYVGPAFDQFLVGTKTQYNPKAGEAFSPFVKDSEQFCILGEGKPLPFPAREDLTLDEKFSADLVTARKDVNIYLGESPHNNTIHPQKVLRIQDSFGIDFTLDRDIFYLYHTILPLIRKDNSRELGVMKTRLEEMMLLSPRLTAPILEWSFALSLGSGAGRDDAVVVPLRGVGENLEKDADHFSGERASGAG